MEHFEKNEFKMEKNAGDADLKTRTTASGSSPFTWKMGHPKALPAISEKKCVTRGRQRLWKRLLQTFTKNDANERKKKAKGVACSAEKKKKERQNRGRRRTW